MVIAYRQNKNGQVTKRIVHTRNSPRFRGEPAPDHFSRGLLRAYYDLECNQGTRFRSTYPKSVIKKVHERAIQRFEHTGDRLRP